MARPRNAQGWVSVVGGNWVGHWDVYIRLEDGREVRRDRQRILGRVSKKFPEWRAREELAKLMQAEPGLRLAKPDPRTTLDWFYEHRFKPLAMARWRKSTKASHPYAVKNLLARFGNYPLGDITRFEVQAWLDSLDFSRWYLLKLRMLLHQIFEEAIEQEYVDRNPVTRKTTIHHGRAASDRYLALEELARLEQLDGRERLIFHMLTLLGLRPGELFARRWRDWQDDRLAITDDVFRGELDATKTAGSRGFVWLPQLLRAELAAWRAQAKWTADDDFIFCYLRGVPLDAANYLKRVFKGSCALLGVSDVTFQCFRRTCSTYVVRFGGNIKDAQAHLRHAQASTTLAIYTKEIPESVKAAVESLSRALFPRAAFHQGELFPKERVN